MRRYEAVLALLIVAVLVVAWRLDPSFLGLETQIELGKLILEPALIALAMTLVVLTGGIDLSVGASMSLAAVAFGLSHERGWPLPLCAVVALAIGAACGFLNGVFVTKVLIHPLIVTLATMAAFFGLAEGLSRARPISGFPDQLAVGLGPVVAAVVVVFAAAAAAVFTKRTVWGQALYVIGTNEKAARFSGVPVDRIKATVYALAGSAAGVAAVMYAARRNTVKADVGQGLELEVITAVVLGGAAITGGRGTVFGTVLGLVLLHELRQFVGWHWERDELNLVVVGSVLILAVLANSLLNRKKAEP